MAESTNHAKTLTSQEASRFVRHFWIAYNNQTLYGQTHPLTDTAVRAFHKTMGELLTKAAPITIHLQQDVLFCEDWRIEGRAYGARMIPRWSDAGITSVSFESSPTIEELWTFLRVLSNARDFPSATKISQELERKNVQSMHFNYITYQKITNDEIIVSSDLGQLADAFSLAEFVKDPQKTTSSILAVASGQRPAKTTAEHLRALREQVTSRLEKEEQLPSTDDLVDALSVINKSVIEQLQIHADTARITSEERMVVDELEGLTFQVVLGIVRDEYKNGAISPQRLAHIVQRLVPNPDELRRLLPLLKKTLLEEGMSMEEYLVLVKELANELDQEDILDSLREAGESVGVSVEEILKEMNRNPDAAVRLILLASEIGSSLGSDEDQLRALITRYIERLGSKMVLGRRPDIAVADVKSQQVALQEMEAELLAQMGADAHVDSGLGKTTISRIEEQLSENLPEQLLRLRADRFVMEVANEDGPLEETARLDTLINLVDEDNNALDLLEPLGEVLEERGLEETSILRVVRQIKNKQTRRKPTMPKGIARPKETKKQLDIEIKRNQRYNTPVTCLSLSLGIKSRDHLCEATQAQLAQLLSSVHDVLVMALRDLDIIGSLGSLGDNYLLIILTMTGASGAHIVAERLHSQINALDVPIDGIQERLVALITQSPYDKEKSKDLTAFLRSVRTHHKRLLKDSFTATGQV